MPKYTRKLLKHIFILLFILAAAIANWFLPRTSWLGDTPVYRFIWLGIFFILLDLVFELIQRSMKQMQLMGDMMSFGRDLKKLEKGFQVIPKARLPNGAIADYVVVGPSGIWLVTVKDEEGKISFNGDELVQDNVVLKSVITQSLQKSYTLSELLKNKLNRDFKVAAVIAFMSPRIDLNDMSNM